MRRLLRRNGHALLRTAPGHEYACQLCQRHGVSASITGRNRCSSVNGQSVPISTVSGCSKRREQQVVTRSLRQLGAAAIAGW